MKIIADVDAGITAKGLQSSYYAGLQANSYGLIQLLESGYGFNEFSDAACRWGTTDTISSILTMGEKWVDRGYACDSKVILQISDISKADLSPFGIHQSHTHGVEYDMSLIHSNQIQSSVGDLYSRDSSSPQVTYRYSTDVTKLDPVDQPTGFHPDYSDLYTNYVLDIIFEDSNHYTILFNHIEEILSRTGIDATTGYDSTKELKYYPGHQNHLHVKYNN